MKITAREEALSVKQEFRQRQDERMNEYIESLIAEWTEDDMDRPIEFVLERPSERRSAQRLLNLYAEAGWDVTTDAEYARIMMR